MRVSIITEDNTMIVDDVVKKVDCSELLAKGILSINYHNSEGFLEATDIDNNRHFQNLTELPEWAVLKSAYDQAEDENKRLEEVQAEEEQEQDEELPVPTAEELVSMLRRERHARLADCDWVVVKAMEKGESVPSDWATYREQLRDIPAQQQANNWTIHFDKDNNWILFDHWPSIPA